MSATLERVRDQAEEVEAFPLGKCSPSDDPDKQTAYLYAFREIATRFVASVRRLRDDGLNEMVADLDLNPEYIQDAYALRATLLSVCDAVDELDDEALLARQQALATQFIDERIMEELRQLTLPQFDTAKLIRFCEELNDCYVRGNYLACLLLIRAVMNHVPPVFGFESFDQVAAHSGRSVGKILMGLQDTARPLSDLQNHARMRSKEVPPTRSQVEPYRGGFEVLITEVIACGLAKGS